MSQILEILGCKYPIIQGPIGALNHPKMVAAVSEAGAFGLIALGYATDMEAVKTTVAQIKDLTDKPFGANLMIAMNPNNEAILDAAMQGPSACPWVVWPCAPSSTPNLTDFWPRVQI